MADQTSASGLSPLDQIRLVEADIARNIAAAREASERAVAEARAQAARLKKEAREAGMREGQIRYKEIVAKAEEEARAIVSRAHKQASMLRQKGQSRMETAIQEAVNIVLGALRRESQ